MRKFIGKVINAATLKGNHSMFSLLLNTLKEVAIVIICVNRIDLLIKEIISYNIQNKQSIKKYIYCATEMHRYWLFKKCFTLKGI